MVELVDTLDLGSNERSYRFESCYPHHETGYPFWDSPFHTVLSTGTQTELDETVRWTATYRRQAGDNTIIFSEGENANRVLLRTQKKS